MSRACHAAAAPEISPNPLLSLDLTDKFGDISKEIERRRVNWVQGYLKTSDYEFGDLTTKFVRDITGKDDCATRA